MSVIFAYVFIFTRRGTVKISVGVGSVGLMQSEPSSSLRRMLPTTDIKIAYLTWIFGSLSSFFFLKKKINCTISKFESELYFKVFAFLHLVFPKQWLIK